MVKWRLSFFVIVGVACELAWLLPQGCAAIVYPPQDTAAALQNLFLQGPTNDTAWHCKLALLLYYTLDAGLNAPADAFW